jgi:thiamine-phosphate pyrophosphorylase
MLNKLYRVIDANSNRTKEGLRVCEDIIRFIVSDTELTRKLKDIRHQVTDTVKSLKINPEQLVSSRDAEHDAGQKSTPDELKKENVKDLLYANFQRCKESVRVLEETAKLIDKDKAEKFKNIRYKIYDLEKEAISRISSVLNNR